MPIPRQTTGAGFDHSGLKLYVLAGASNTFGTHYCNLLQSFEIATNTGSFTFKGSALMTRDLPSQVGSRMRSTVAIAKTPMPTTWYLTCYRTQCISAPEQRYAHFPNFHETEPSPHGSHIILAQHRNGQDPIQPPGRRHRHDRRRRGLFSSKLHRGHPSQRDFHQHLAEHARPRLFPLLWSMSPSGKLLGGNLSANPYLDQRTRVFHFNGADPITPYSKTLTTAAIDQIHWDETNHLYALSDEANKLYVYTVTPTSISEAPGSPYTISGGDVECFSCCGKFMLRTCFSGGRDLLPPQRFQRQLASAGRGGFESHRNHRQHAVVGRGVRTSTPRQHHTHRFCHPGPGSHRFAVIATNTSGQKWESTVTATVK